MQVRAITACLFALRSDSLRLLDKEQQDLPGTVQVSGEAGDNRRGGENRRVLCGTKAHGL